MCVRSGEKCPRCSPNTWGRLFGGWSPKGRSPTQNTRKSPSSSWSLERPEGRSLVLDLLSPETSCAGALKLQFSGIPLWSYFLLNTYSAPHLEAHSLWRTSTKCWNLVRHFEVFNCFLTYWKKNSARSWTIFWPRELLSREKTLPRKHWQFHIET